MNDDDEVKEGLKKSMAEPAKKKKTDEDQPNPDSHDLDTAYGSRRANDLRQEWEQKFSRNRG